MEVELDVHSPDRTWGQALKDWAAFCRETWLCEELQLFRVGADLPLLPVGRSLMPMALPALTAGCAGATAACRLARTACCCAGHLLLPMMVCGAQPRA